jgi:hypothetical protein
LFTYIYLLSLQKNTAMVGFIFPHRSYDDEPKVPLTPEEIRESVKTSATVIHLLLSAMFAVIGLFALAVGVIDSAVWGYIIGLILVLFSFFCAVSISDTDADMHGEVVRKMGGGIVSFIFLVSAFVLVIESHFTIGAILYLLGFIMSFRVSKTYSIVSAIILLGLHILALLG